MYKCRVYVVLWLPELEFLVVRSREFSKSNHVRISLAVGTCAVLPIDSKRIAMARLLKLSPSSQEDIVLSSPSEERKGLLSGVDTLPVSEADEPKLSSLWRNSRLTFGPARIAAVIGAFFGLVLGGFYWFSAPSCSARALHFNGDTLRSNGTQEFKRTVLLVSIDGLRHVLFGPSSLRC